MFVAWTVMFAGPCAAVRHVFCTTALFGWKMSDEDVAAMAGHASSRITRDMHVGKTAGTFERARPATAA
jgi:hypothetical protein